MAARTIVHIITRLDRGGSAQNTMLTVLGHDRAEFEPVVVAGDPGRWDAQGGMAATEEHRRRLEEKGTRVVLLPSLVRPISPWNDLCALWVLVGLLRELRPAIVHTHTSKAGVLGRLAAWIARVPAVVHTPHGHVFYGHFGPWKSRLFLAIERMLAPLTTTLIALTGAERADHLERGVGVPERFAVIPSGIDVNRFHRARANGRRIPEWFGCPDDAVVIGSIGWLTDIKGHRVLIDALGLLHREFPRAHVVVVGSGDQHDALLAQAERLGLRERVHLVGHREQVESCLAGMDCFVLPSFNEGMGRALIEAMAAGLPVVASRVGGIPAVVEHDVNGLLAEAGDSRALADAIRRILSRPEWAEMLGRRAAQRIGGEFGAEAMVQAIEQVYRDATAPTARPSTLAQGLACFVLMCSLAVSTSPADAASRTPLRVALHVHSTASTGTLTLEELATRAEQQGLDAIVLSDNFTLDYEYGLWPFRSLVKKTVSYPSVLAYGIDRYLAEIEAVQARHPGLVIVPGVEVAPFYYWTGSIWHGDLTMHDAQRNLLVVGLTRADDYRALPARGNPDSFRKDGQMFQWAPLLLLVPAVALWNPFRRTSRGWHEPVGPLRRTAALLCAVFAVTPIMLAGQAGTPVFSSYDTQLGYRPYQMLIDAAVERGAAVVWSMTEAHDFQTHTFGPLGAVTVRTDPHPEALALTTAYTAFGGVYQDTRSVTQPGDLWDRTIHAGLGGPSHGGPTLVGEIAFHGLADRGKDLDRVVTVVEATERSIAGVVDAIRSGHVYAVAEGDRHVQLMLESLQVTDDAGSTGAGIGDRLTAPVGAHPVVHARVAARDGKPYPATLRVIRSGSVIGSFTGDTPIDYRVVDEQAVTREGAYYRVAISGTSGELLTNPVYVDVAAGERG